MKTLRKNISRKIIAFAVCVAMAFSLSGCFLFGDGTDISSVRERVEVLRSEVSDTLIAAFRNRDTAAAKALFCRKTQELNDIDEQIEKGFDFLGDEIAAYHISVSTSYEGYSNDYGTIAEYDFGSTIFMTTATGKKYELYFQINYITADKPIEGMTFFNIRESSSDYENYKKQMVGYPWSSQYDPECGIIAAELVKTLAAKDDEALKGMMYEAVPNSPTLESEIQAVFALFDGRPLFTERADGLYDYSDNEKDFSCRVLGSKNGGSDRLWVHVLAQIVHTDTDRKYSLDYTAYLSTETRELIGIAYLSLRDFDSDEEAKLGVWE